jgi:hypothetical protein
VTLPVTPDGDAAGFDHAETALQCATNCPEAMAAIREFFDAKAEAKANVPSAHTEEAPHRKDETQ